MLDVNLIIENANKLNRDGIAPLVLKQAESIYNDSWETSFSALGRFNRLLAMYERLAKSSSDQLKTASAEEFKEYLKEDILENNEKYATLSENISEKLKEYMEEVKSHVGPETIARYISLFGEDLTGVKVLDLGCGAGEYAPILPIALSKLGANVFGVDVELDDTLDGIDVNYKKMNLNYPEYFDSEPEFFKGNDIIIARSFLDGGFHSYDKHSRYRDKHKEFSVYKEMIDKVRELNDQAAIYELDFPFSSSLIGDDLDGFLEREFGKPLCKYRSLQKSIYLFDK